MSSPSKDDLIRQAIKFLGEVEHGGGNYEDRKHHVIGSLEAALLSDALEPVSDFETGPPGIIRPEDMPFVSKRWGWELWPANNPKYCGKLIFIKQGHWLSYHHHSVKDEVLYVHQGQIDFTHDQHETTETVVLSEGYGFHVTPGIIHQMYAHKDTLLIEFSTQHLDEDSYRTTTERVHGDVRKFVG